jgi:hypothetical protein
MMMMMTNNFHHPSQKQEEALSGGFHSFHLFRSVFASSNENPIRDNSNTPTVSSHLSEPMMILSDYFPPSNYLTFFTLRKEVKVTSYISQSTSHKLTNL